MDGGAMRLFIILASVSVLSSGCATLNPYGNAGLQCGVSILNELTIKEVECLETKGVKDEKFAKLRERLEKERLEEFNRQLARVVITKYQLTAPIGGTVRAGVEIAEAVVKFKIANFCKSGNLDGWDIIEVSRSKEYLGEVGGTSAHCNRYGCSSYGSYSPRYFHFDEIKFQCRADKQASSQ
jgi:hypothetical protein